MRIIKLTHQNSDYSFYVLEFNPLKSIDDYIDIWLLASPSLCDFLLDFFPIFFIFFLSIFFFIFSRRFLSSANLLALSSAFFLRPSAFSRYSASILSITPGSSNSCSYLTSICFFLAKIAFLRFISASSFC